MRRKFRERIGTADSPEILIDDINDDIRNGIWNAFYMTLIEPWESAANSPFGYDLTKTYEYQALHNKIYLNVFHQPLDEFSRFDYKSMVKQFFYGKEWDEVYEILEEIIYATRNAEVAQGFIDVLNERLEFTFSGYRVVGNSVVPITNPSEIEELNIVSKNSLSHQLNHIDTHLQQALTHLKPDGDLRNSIKESISMVEAMAKTLAPNEKTLGKAINKLEKNGEISSLLKGKYQNFYEYTNSKDGIRHSLMEDPDLSVEDARYFLISCSAFTNYLFEKGRKMSVL